jgi:hypothetical protein
VADDDRLQSPLPAARSSRSEDLPLPSVASVPSRWSDGRPYYVLTFDQAPSSSILPSPLRLRLLLLPSRPIPLAACLPSVIRSSASGAFLLYHRRRLYSCRLCRSRGAAEDWASAAHARRCRTASFLATWRRLLPERRAALRNEGVFHEIVWRPRPLRVVRVGSSHELDTVPVGSGRALGQLRRPPMATQHERSQHRARRCEAKGGSQDS